MRDRPLAPETGMKMSSLASAVAVDSTEGWSVHYRALADRAAGGDVIVLSVGDPDFDTPAAITEAAIASLRQGETHYTHAGGIRPLISTIAERETTRLGWSVGEDRVAVCSGAQNALYSAMCCLVDEGDEVVLLSPPYTMFEGVVGAARGTVKLVPLQRAQGFQVDLDRLGATVNGNTRAILLNSPHNPSGAIASGEVLERIAELCIRNGIWLISDEVYADLCFEPGFVSPSTLEGMRDRTVIVRSLSKSHAMTGWRVGWMVAPPSVCTAAKNLLNHVLYGGPAFIQRGAIAALQEALQEAAGMKDAYRARRDVIVEALSGVSGLECLCPDAGIFCIVGIERLGMPAKVFAERLYAAEGVSVLPGEAFGAGHSDWVRVSLCQPEDVLVEAVKRIARFTSGIQGQKLEKDI